MKKLVLTLVFILTLFLLNASAKAQTNDDPYYQIANVQTDVTTATSEEDSTTDSLLQAQSSFLVEEAPTFQNIAPEQHAGIDPLTIAELLLKVWDIVQENKPIVNVQQKNASALPVIASSNWEALTGWQPEHVVNYHTVMTNGFGMNVVDFSYQVKLLYGGGYNGAGKYIASARVVPVSVNVLWGFNLDVTVNVPSVVNVSSKADPLAAITMEVTYQVKSVLKNETETQSYLLQGDGLLRNQTSGKVYFPSSKS